MTYAIHVFQTVPCALLTSYTSKHDIKDKLLSLILRSIIVKQFIYLQQCFATHMHYNLTTTFPRFSPILTLPLHFGGVDQTLLSVSIGFIVMRRVGHSSQSYHGISHPAGVCCQKIYGMYGEISFPFMVQTKIYCCAHFPPKSTWILLISMGNFLTDGWRILLSSKLSLVSKLKCLHTYPLTKQ